MPVSDMVRKSIGCSKNQAVGDGFSLKGLALVAWASTATIRLDGLVIERLSEEHATVRATAGTRLEPGSRVFVLPNHSCVVSNLVDEIVLVDGDEVIDRLPVAARGRIQ